MACEEIRQKVAELVQDQKTAQADCKAGIKSQCGVAKGLLEAIALERKKLAKCLKAQKKK